MPFLEKMTLLDPVGVVLLLGSVCCLFLALQWGGTKYSWGSGQCIGLFIGFAFLLVNFCFVQWCLGDIATIPPRILKERTVSFGALALFLISMSSNIVSSSSYSIEALLTFLNRKCITYHFTSKRLKAPRRSLAAFDFLHSLLHKSLRQSSQEVLPRKQAIMYDCSMLY